MSPCFTVVLSVRSVGSWQRSAPNCITCFHWLMGLFWPFRFDVTIVSIGKNYNVKPDRPELPYGIVVKSNLIGQNDPVNQGNALYNWVQCFCDTQFQSCMVFVELCSLTSFVWNLSIKQILVFQPKRKFPLPMLQEIHLVVCSETLVQYFQILLCQKYGNVLYKNRNCLNMDMDWSFGIIKCNSMNLKIEYRLS